MIFFRPLLILTILFFAACDDETKEVDKGLVTDTTQNTEEVFEGITLTDAYNVPLGFKGSEDTDDWSNNGNLPQEVVEIFENFPSPDLKGTKSGDVSISAFPNPCRDIIYLRFILSENSHVKALLFNQSFEIIDRWEFFGSEELRIDVSDDEKFSEDEVLRLYYVISSEDKAEFFSGHGDIWICKTETCSID